MAVTGWPDSFSRADHKSSVRALSYILLVRYRFKPFLNVSSPKKFSSMRITEAPLL